jgi:hypothetical protein
MRYQTALRPDRRMDGRSTTDDFRLKVDCPIKVAAIGPNPLVQPDRRQSEREGNKSKVEARKSAISRYCFFASAR